MKISTQNHETGNAIIMVLGILVVLMVIVGVATEYTTTINRHVQRSNTQTNAMAVGDGCLDVLFARWREYCRLNPGTAPSTRDLQNLVLPTQAMFPSIPNFTVSRTSPTPTPTVQLCKVIAVDPELTPMSTNNVPTPSAGQDPGNLTYNYRATATVTLPSVRGNVTATVQRIFQKEVISPWNFAIFYIDPLEIHPGAPFNVTGWVHTNSNLYTATSYLNFSDKVTYGVDWSIGWKPGDSRYPNNPVPQSPTWVSNLPPALDAQKEPFGWDSASIFSTTDSNQDNDGYHELIEPPVNNPSYPDPLDGQRFYDQATLVVEINSDGTPKISKKDSTSSTGLTLLTSSSNNEDLALYNMIKNAVTVAPVNTTTFYDFRETKNIRATTIDVGQLIATTTTSTGGSNGGTVNSGDYKGYSFNANPIIYIWDSRPNPTGASANKPAIRLTNGTSIPYGGLTIASANPVYIQGDFNTGGTAPPSNNSGGSDDPTQPQGSRTIMQKDASGSYSSSGTYARQPCSIVSDAVNILSNAWTDSGAASGTLLSSANRAASNTTVNTAILSGNVPTGTVGSNYSGGAENFPRFLENWAGKNLTYYGSMVEIFASQQATHPWIGTGDGAGGSIYNPPARRWYFEKNFKKSPPPGSFSVVNFIKGRWKQCSEPTCTQ